MKYKLIKEYPMSNTKMYALKETNNIVKYLNINNGSYIANGTIYAAEFTKEEIENQSQYWQKIEEDIILEDGGGRLEFLHDNIWCTKNNRIFTLTVVVLQPLKLRIVADNAMDALNFADLTIQELYNRGYKLFWSGNSAKKAINTIQLADGEGTLQPYMTIFGIRDNEIIDFHVERDTANLDYPLKLRKQQGERMNTILSYIEWQKRDYILYWNRKNAEKAVRKPLFTTEDGVDIFIGDRFYFFAEGDKYVRSLIAINNNVYTETIIESSSIRTFSTEGLSIKAFNRRKALFNMEEIEIMINTSKFLKGYGDFGPQEELISEFQELLNTKLKEK